MAKAPRYDGLHPATPRASAVARRSSRKTGTRCEVALARALRRRGLRFGTAISSLPGRPDIIFRRDRVVVFCDGDFWHGRAWKQRKQRLMAGHNAGYWVAKIEANRRRDRRTRRALRLAGWTVLRFWESEIHRSPDRVAAKVAALVGPTSAKLADVDRAG